MNSATFNDTKYNVPGSWNELSRRQLLGIARLCLRPEDGANRIRLLMVLLNIRWYRFRLKRYFDKIKAEQRLDMLRLTSFIDKSNDLTVNLIPSITHNPKLFGPPSDFSNSTVFEFISADSFYLIYRETKDPAWLDKMIACFYRPQRKNYNPKAPDFDGDRREPFNDALVGRRARKLKRLPAHYKKAIELWYQGCRYALEQAHPNVFSGVSGKKSEAEKFGWGTVIAQMAGPKTGTIEQTGHLPIYTFMMLAEIAIINANELEASLKQSAKSN